MGLGDLLSLGSLNPDTRDRSQPAGVGVAKPTGPTATTPGTQMPPGPDTGITDPNVGAPTIPATNPSVNPPAAPVEPTAGLSDITQRLLNISGTDVDYLRGQPYSTNEEQAMRAREQDRVRNEFGTARQRLTDQLGTQQGMSGVLSGALEKLAEGEASEMSKVDRDIMIKAADEMRSRRAESRGVVGSLEGLENQRMMQSLGLGQTVDESERARLNDLMAAMGMAPNPAQATGAASNLLQAAQGLGANASAQSASNIQGISTLADLFSKMGWMK